MTTSIPMFRRREFLRVSAGAVLASAGVLTSGCSDDADDAAAPSTSSGPATTGRRRGGRLRIGALGAADPTLDPANVQGNADFLAVLHVFDSLTLLGDGDVRLWLAESIEPNGDATTWTVRVRPDARFHDGAPVRAGDVIASLDALVASPFYSTFLGDIDVAGLRAVDDRTVTVPLLRPRADFVEGALATGVAVFPEGTTDFSAAIGSGPFRLRSFEPGVATVLERNPDHWAGEVLLDEVEIRTIPDTTARINALRSGELDLAMRVSAAGARTLEPEGLQVIRGGEADADVLGFVMNTTIAPFDDPAVRLACKLACDRRALIDTVLLGEGAVGNDLMGLGLPGYDTSIPQREHDPDEARRLFAEAGVTELPLKVADLTPGIVAAGEVYAEQLRAVGVEVRTEEADPATYFVDYAQLLATPMQGMYFINRPVAAALPFLTGSRSTFNISGYAPAGHDELLDRAQATVDATARADLHHQAQRGLWEDGGDLLWGYQPVLHAASPAVGGVELTQSFPFLAQATVS